MRKEQLFRLQIRKMCYNVRKGQSQVSKQTTAMLA